LIILKHLEYNKNKRFNIEDCRFYLEKKSKEDLIGRPMFNTYLFTIDWNATYAGSPPLWRILLSIFIFLLGILLAVVLTKYMPLYIEEIVKALDERSRKKTDKKKEVQQKREISVQLRTINFQVKRFIWWFVLLIYGFLSFSALEYNIYTKFKISEYSFTIWMMVQFLIIILIFVIFIRTVLSPITKLLLQAIFGRTISKWIITKEHEKFENSLNSLFLFIGIYVALHIAFPNTKEIPLYEYISSILGLAGIIIGSYFAVRLFLLIFRINYIIPNRMDMHAANAIENIILILSVLIIIGLILSFFNIDWYAILGALTFIGLAIAFGMQDSIANIMAGFTLAGDKPFVIGDRVRVGEVERETWGDVVKIGLNSTRIRTVEGELVVVPNAYIAKNEIWNYTRESPVIVQKIDIGISYGSDWRLAKKIIIDEARAHPRILRNPQPFVLLDEFSDFSLKLKIWIWLKHALDREQVRSDLLEAIKDRFDKEGVEIPFPYRTLVYKNDISKEKQLEDLEAFINIRRYPSHGRDYYEYGDWHKKAEPSGVVAEEGVRILVTSANPYTAEKLARYSMEFAKKVNGKIIVLYVMPEYSRPREEEGLKIIEVFERYGRAENILVGTMIEIGDIVNEVIKYTKENKTDFIIIGKSPKGGAFSWAKDNIEEEIKELSNIPVITVQD
jgi:small-conductance mechanosensitive channel